MSVGSGNGVAAKDVLEAGPLVEVVAVRSTLGATEGGLQRIEHCDTNLGHDLPGELVRCKHTLRPKAVIDEPVVAATGQVNRISNAEQHVTEAPAALKTREKHCEPWEVSCVRLQ